MSEDRHGTRGRIQAVAVELFAEQGYDKTSLREIAERLGVTKAALYYHFRSKEEIVRSLFTDYTAEVDELIAWGRGQPRTAETRRELLGRYVDIVVRRTEVFQCLERNQATIRNLETEGKERFHERLRALGSLLQPPDAPLRERVRASMAFIAVHVGWLFFQDEQAGPDELRAIVHDVACELAGAPAATPTAGVPATSR
ncbi:MAG: TetR/AcrR family transcriptional regulator [Micromonosporaceae bacterium]